jgi:hypothetical protein
MGVYIGRVHAARACVRGTIALLGASAPGERIGDGGRPGIECDRVQGT